MAARGSFFLALKKLESLSAIASSDSYAPIGG